MPIEKVIDPIEGRAVYRAGPPRNREGEYVPLRDPSLGDPHYGLEDYVAPSVLTKMAEHFDPRLKQE
jgi:hypothetical protein